MSRGGAGQTALMPERTRLFPRALGVVAVVLLAASLKAAGPLTTAREVLALAPESLAQNPAVRLRGVVTYFKADGFSDLVVQDGTGGLFITGLTSNTAPALRPGLAVEVEGAAGAGSFTPRVLAGRVTVLGANAPPTPERVSFDDLKSGRFDCRYVEAAGVVRAAAVDDLLTPPRLILRVAMPAGQFYAWVLRFGDDDGQRFIDAAVRVRGVCLAWENPRRQFTSLRLLVNDLDAVTITRAPPADPFAAPLVSADTLLRYQPDGMDAHRVRLRGVVTWWRPGDYLVIQDANFGLRVNSDSRALLKLGDAVEVAGFPALMGYSAGLQDAVYRVTGHPGEPAAQSIEPSKFLTGQWTVDTDQKLVRLAGTLRGVQRSGWEIILALEEAGVNFVALLQHGDDTRWAEELEPGSRLELTGVCDVRPTDRRRMVGGVPDGFALLLRGRPDVTVLRAGPWLNQRRLRLVLAVSGGALLLALVWAFTLRRRVEQRTAQLAREIRSRHDAEVEFNATLGERARIATELHDGLQQSLTGVALQLEAAGLAARQSPEQAPQHLETARELLTLSREELRRALWNLRERDGNASEPRRRAARTCPQHEPRRRGEGQRISRGRRGGGPRPGRQPRLPHRARGADQHGETRPRPMRHRRGGLPGRQAYLAHHRRRRRLRSDSRAGRGHRPLRAARNARARQAAGRQPDHRQRAGTRHHRHLGGAAEMKSTTPIRLLLADDHFVVRAGLAAVLKFDTRFRVIAEAGDGVEAVKAHRQHQPDVALLDVRMPVMDGIEAARRIRAEFPAARLLMLTTSETEEDIHRALEAGAAGYAPKNSSAAELTCALLAVHRNERWIPADLARRLEERTREAPLSSRQLEVLELLAKGLSNKEIATVLGFTTDGTKAHLKSIYAKLGVQGRAEAVTIGMQKVLLRVE